MTVIHQCLMALGELRAERRYRREEKSSVEVKLFIREENGLCGLFALEWLTGNILDIWQVEMFTGERKLLGRVTLRHFDGQELSVAIIVSGFVKGYLRMEE